MSPSSTSHPFPPSGTSSSEPGSPSPTIGYVGLVEHESAATFAQMHASPAAHEVQRRLHTIVAGGPRADVYEIVEAATQGGCCDGTGGVAGTAAAERVEVGTAGKSGCCHGS